MTTGGYKRWQVSPSRALKGGEESSHQLGSVLEAAIDFDLLFIDLDCASLTKDDDVERLTATLQENAHQLGGYSRMVVRWPHKYDEDTIVHVEEWHRRLTGGESPLVAPSLPLQILVHRFGEPPILIPRSADTTLDDRIVLECRAIETTYLLAAGSGFWCDSDYHFELPSGRHTPSFVRTAEAFISTRALEVLALWTLVDARHGMSLVVDTASMIPLLVQIKALMAEYGYRIGSTAILDRYPCISDDVSVCLESVLDPVDPYVVIIQSANDSGKLVEYVCNAIAANSDRDAEWRYHVIFDRGADVSKLAQSSTGAPSPDSVGRWVCLNESVDVDQPSSDCELCGGDEGAAVLVIDPRSYGHVGIKVPDPVMIDLTFAQSAAPLWEEVGTANSVEFDAPPHPSSAAARGKRQILSVRMNFESLLTYGNIERLVENSARFREAKEMARKAAFIIVPSKDREESELVRPEGRLPVPMGDKVEEVLAMLGASDKQVVSPEDPGFDAIVRSAGDAKEQVLVFTWGSVTGFTLRHLKVRVAEACRGTTEPTVNAVVLVARPSTRWELEMAANPIRPGKLVPLYTVMFPWRSPFREERKLLERHRLALKGLSPEGESFLNQRLEFLRPTAGSGPSPAAPNKVGDRWLPFWGMSTSQDDDPRLTGESLYGTELPVPAAFAAIGSAIQATRGNAGRVAPFQPRFDMIRTISSYYDAIITCSVLRWLWPSEMSWAESDFGGPNDVDERVCATISLVCDDPSRECDQTILLPELLLAGALGRLPRRSIADVHEVAERTMGVWAESNPTSRGAIEVARAVLSSQGQIGIGVVP